MSIVDIIVLVMSILGWAAFFLLSISWMYRFINRRGYRNPHALYWLVPAGVLVIFVALLFAILTFVNAWSSKIDTTDVIGTLLIALPSYVSLFISIGIVALILLKIPPKRRTGPGKVRFPYRVVSGLSFAAGIIGPIVLLFLHVSLTNILRLFGIFIGMGLAFSYLARRAAAPRLDEAVLADARPPVLYLRSFDEEDDVFAELPGRKWRILDYFNAYLYYPDTPYLTFEQFIMKSVRTSLGPFVALGNPQDSLPPLGGSRFYVPDVGETPYTPSPSDATHRFMPEKEWQKEVADRTAEAQCILVPISRTPGLVWELGYLIYANLHKKLFILLPPAELSRPARWVNFVMSFTTARKTDVKTKSVPWTAFRQVLAEAKLEYVLPVADPGFGSVITFDLAGNAITLVQGAETADEYVEAIAKRLSQLREVAL